MRTTHVPFAPFQATQRTRFLLAALLVGGWVSMLGVMSTRVLVVDDHPDLAEAVRELLESQGVVVTGVAFNSAEALRVVVDQDPDVVLVDVDLGDESGFDLAERLMPAGGRGWPVVLMSAHDESDLEDLVRRSSALGFVSKARLSADAVRGLLDDHQPDGGGGGGGG